MMARRPRPAEYEIWSAMIQRCHNPKNQAFPRYDGRGILVCDAWRASFKTFAAAMGTRPSARHTLDRIDNDGPYTFDNCRWATKREQALNTRRNVRLEHQGRTLTL